MPRDLVEPFAQTYAILHSNSKSFMIYVENASASAAVNGVTSWGRRPAYICANPTVCLVNNRVIPMKYFK
jgi:hypothetical protein